MEIKFTKMEAFANDFMLIDAFDNKSFNPETLKELSFHLCDRRRGVGADGVIFLDARKSGKLSNIISIRIFNADGSEAETCGNGISCAARFAYDNVYTKGKREFEFLLEKIKRKTTVFVDDDEITVDMGIAELRGEHSTMVNGQAFSFSIVNIGNPHAVIFIKDIESVELPMIASAIQSDGALPESVNVQFAQVIDSSSLKLRTWERGVGETFACGSGACSVVALGITKGLCEKKTSVIMPGGTTRIVQRSNSMFLTAKANYVFKGEL